MNWQSFFDASARRCRDGLEVKVGRVAGREGMQLELYEWENVLEISNDRPGVCIQCIELL